MPPTQRLLVKERLTEKDRLPRQARVVAAKDIVAPAIHLKVLARNVADDSTLASRDSQGLIHSTGVICAPIRSKDKIIGLVHVYSTDPDSAPDADDLEFTLYVADNMAMALRRLEQQKALAAEPLMIAGSGRFCSQVIEATAGRALVKTGAEGVFCGALPELGLGFALKVDDGAGRAAEVVCGRVLRRLGVIGEAETAKLAALFQPSLRNRAGREIGEVRTAADCPF